MEPASPIFNSFKELEARILGRMDLLAEFSESNYEICKFIYDHIEDPENDTEILQKMKSIVRCGGKHAFMKIMEILLDYADLVPPKRLRLFLFFRLHSEKVMEPF
jgi:hypothetical protein